MRLMSYRFHIFLCLHVTRCHDTGRKKLVAVQKQEETLCALQIWFYVPFHIIYWLPCDDAAAPLWRLISKNLTGRASSGRFLITKDFLNIQYKSVCFMTAPLSPAFSLFPWCSTDVWEVGTFLRKVSRLSELLLLQCSLLMEAATFNCNGFKSGVSL